MTYDAIKSGVIIIYPFLWSRQAALGESEGRKHRPVVVAVRVPHPNKNDLLILFPITTKQPSHGQFAVEVPETKKYRAGLDPMLRQWIILDECNEDEIPGSYYVEPVPPVGAFSKRFFLPLVLDFIKRRERTRVTARR